MPKVSTRCECVVVIRVKVVVETSGGVMVVVKVVMLAPGN